MSGFAWWIEPLEISSIDTPAQTEDGRHDFFESNPEGMNRVRKRPNELESGLPPKPCNHCSEITEPLGVRLAFHPGKVETACEINEARMTGYFPGDYANEILSRIRPTGQFGRPTNGGKMDHSNESLQFPWQMLYK